MTLHQAYYRNTLKQTQSLQWIYGYALTTVNVTLISHFEHLQSARLMFSFLCFFVLFLHPRLNGSHILFFIIKKKEERV